MIHTIVTLPQPRQIPTYVPSRTAWGRYPGVYAAVPAASRGRGMGDLFDTSSLLGAIGTPTESTGMSPILMLGLGLLAFAFLMKYVLKGTKAIRKRSRKRAEKRDRIAALEAELRRVKAS